MARKGVNYARAKEKRAVIVDHGPNVRESYVKSLSTVITAK